VIPTALRTGRDSFPSSGSPPSPLRAHRPPYPLSPPPPSHGRRILPPLPRIALRPAFGRGFIPRPLALVRSQGLRARGGFELPPFLCRQEFGFSRCTTSLIPPTPKWVPSSTLPLGGGSDRFLAGGWSGRPVGFSLHS